jgi:hypothetical protein
MILRHPLTRHEIAVEASDWFAGCAYFRCPRTGFEWLHPAPASVFPDFSHYADRLHRENHPVSFRDHTPPFERAALAWVKKELRPGATIAEFFAETGRVAWHLQRDGYKIQLADPVANHVMMLRRHGFDAVQSADANSLPASWGEPDAVLILESLIRLSDPRGFLESLRRRWPRARLFVTVPSPRRPLKLEGVNHRGGFPPDFLTRWTLPALHEALTLSGCQTRSWIVTPASHRLVEPGRWKRRVFNAAFDLMLRANGEFEFSFAAAATPQP